MSLWDSAILCTDADLTDQESRMPELGKKVVAESGKTAYDGKRLLAKRDIAAFLKRTSYHTAGLTDPTQFNRAAVFLELAYIYRDLAVRNDTISKDKSDDYLLMYKEEIESLQIDYADPGVEDTSEKIQVLKWRA